MKAAKRRNQGKKKSAQRDRRTDRKNLSLAKQMGLHTSEFDDGPVTVDRVLNAAQDRELPKSKAAKEVDRALDDLQKATEAKRKAGEEALKAKKAEKAAKRAEQYKQNEARLKRAAANRNAQNDKHRQQREETARKVEEARKAQEEADRKAEEARKAQEEAQHKRLAALVQQAQSTQNHKLANLATLQQSITATLNQHDINTAKQNLDDLDNQIQQLIQMDNQLANIEAETQNLPRTGPNANDTLTNNMQDKIKTHKETAQALDPINDTKAFSKVFNSLKELETKLTQYQQTIRAYKTPEQLKAEQEAQRKAALKQQLEALELAAWNEMMQDVTVNPPDHPTRPNRVENADLLAMDITDKEIRKFLEGAGKNITLNGRTYHKDSSISGDVSFKASLPPNKQGTNSQGVLRQSFIIHLKASH